MGASDFVDAREAREAGDGLVEAEWLGNGGERSARDLTSRGPLRTRRSCVVELLLMWQKLRWPHGFCRQTRGILQGTIFATRDRRCNMARVKVVQPRVSYADLERAPEDGRRYELYDGEVVTSSVLPNFSFRAHTAFPDR